MSGSGQWRKLYWLFLYGLEHIYVPGEEAGFVRGFRYAVQLMMECR